MTPRPVGYRFLRRPPLFAPTRPNETRLLRGGLNRAGMSEEEDGTVLRTVTKPYRSRADDEMNIIGLLYGLGLLVVLIPLLPFIVLLWVLSKLGRAGASE